MEQIYLKNMPKLAQQFEHTFIYEITLFPNFALETPRVEVKVEFLQICHPSYL